MKAYILALAMIMMTAGFAQAEVKNAEASTVEPPKVAKCSAVGVGTPYKVEVAILEYEVIESEDLPVPVEFASNMESRTLYASAGHMETREIYHINNNFAFDIEIVNCEMPETAQASNGRLG